MKHCTDHAFLNESNCCFCCSRQNIFICRTTGAELKSVKAPEAGEVCEDGNDPDVVKQKRVKAIRTYANVFTLLQEAAGIRTSEKLTLVP